MMRRSNQSYARAAEGPMGVFELTQAWVVAELH